MKMTSTEVFMIADKLVPVDDFNAGESNIGREFDIKLSQRIKTPRLKTADLLTWSKKKAGMLVLYLDNRAMSMLWRPDSHGSYEYLWRDTDSKKAVCRYIFEQALETMLKINALDVFQFHDEDFAKATTNNLIPDFASKGNSK